MGFLSVDAEKLGSLGTKLRDYSGRHMVGVVCHESLGHVYVWPRSYIIYAVSMLGLGLRLLEKLGRLGTKLRDY